VGRIKEADERLFAKTLLDVLIVIREGKRVERLGELVSVVGCSVGIPSCACESV